MFGGGRMEIIGFIIMVVGMSGMDTEGNLWYLAAGMIITGMLMIYMGIYRERRRKECRRHLRDTARKQSKRQLTCGMARR